MQGFEIDEQGRPVMTRNGGFVEREPRQRTPKPEAMGLRELHDSVMSNFDDAIDLEVARQLQEGGCFAQYAGWNFCGYVWWDAEAQEFRCEVWRYHSPIEVVSGSLEDIMDEVSDKWGSV